VLDKLATIQMLDVHFPTTGGRTLILSRYTELNTDQKLLVKQLRLDVTSQPPHHRGGGEANARRDPAGVVETFGDVVLILFTFSIQSANEGWDSRALAFTPLARAKPNRDDGAAGLTGSVMDMLGVFSEFEIKHVPAAVEAHAVQRRSPG
jgi:hypothetical protein